MYCNQCGNILTEQGAFCSFCGAKNDDVAVKAPAAEAPQAAPTVNEAPAPVAETAAPQPEQAAQPAAPVYTPPVMPAGYGNEVPMTPPPASQPVKEEKYYTFKHIAMCLAAVAVMAIVAGVFAGLYFSVV